MIKVIGYQGRPFFITRCKIMAAEKYSETQTKLIMGCGDHSEDWIINETIEDFIQKYTEIKPWPPTNLKSGRR